MSLRRLAEDFFGFPLAVARHSEEPGDQFVALRHRWARRCCQTRTIPFADNSDASTPDRETRPRLEANGINQKGARDDQSRDENKTHESRRMGKRATPFEYSAELRKLNCETQRKVRRESAAILAAGCLAVPQKSGKGRASPCRRSARPLPSISPPV
jgi:hypothetical protein